MRENEPAQTKRNSLLALDASQATITTAIVTIRMLRVNNRQFTQSTFRQLSTRNLIDDEKCEVLGTIWGWVNYHMENDRYTQFVAQFGEELCRCPFHVRKVTPSQGCKEIAWMAEYHEALAWREFFLRVLMEDEHIKSHKWYENGSHLSFPVGRSKVFPCVSVGYESSRTNAINQFFEPREGETWVQKKAKGGIERVDFSKEESKEFFRAEIIELMKKVDREFIECSCPETLEEVYQAMRENDQNAVAYASKWNDLMERLATVPQLFIAV